MPDKITPETRSRLMARVRQRGTEPERIVRTLLRRMRIRYRSHVRRLPGTPDLVLSDFRVVIFVHGCFWHNHLGCRRGTLPASNREFWLPKIARNVQRDHAAARVLRARSWRVATVWQCQTLDLARLSARINRLCRGAER
jgi:DNA mismatch endonuclease, patch repair protein